MFDKLKNAAGDIAIRSAIEKYSHRIAEKLPEITTFKAAEISDDARYHSHIVAPALAKVVAASNGATQLIPDFDRRFSRAMLHLRSQLVIIDAAGDKVSLVPGYESRVSEVLIEGFKKRG
jgi:hypothetical protein